MLFGNAALHPTTVSVGLTRFLHLSSALCAYMRRSSSAKHFCLSLQWSETAYCAI